MKSFFLFHLFCFFVRLFCGFCFSILVFLDVDLKLPRHLESKWWIQHFRKGVWVLLWVVFVCFCLRFFVCEYETGGLSFSSSFHRFLLQSAFSSHTSSFVSHTFSLMLFFFILGSSSQTFRFHHLSISFFIIISSFFCSTFVSHFQPSRHNTTQHNTTNKHLHTSQTKP